MFNRAHSSLRNVIERSFGVWKQRWKILQNMPFFSEYDRNPNLIPDNFLPDSVQASAVQGSQRPSRMDFVRDGIANSLMEQ